MAVSSKRRSRRYAGDMTVDLIHLARCVAIARREGNPEEADDNRGKGKGKTGKGVGKNGKDQKGKGNSQSQAFHQAAIAGPRFNDEAYVDADDDPMDGNE